MFLFVLTLVSCASSQSRVTTEQRIRDVENGLIGFTSPEDMLRPDSAAAEDLETLTERMAHYEVPGVGLAVIEGHQIDWAKSYGVLRVGGEDDATTETLFEAASTTKLLVAAIALRLVEKGRLNLDEDVGLRLQSWKIPESDYTREEKVTLRRLLTHQAGLNRPDGGFDWEGSPTVVQTLNGEAPAKNPPAAIEFLPGSRWQYSNFGYLVLQLLLEDVTGKPFAQIAQEVVFDPVGMKNSTFADPSTKDPAANRIAPHDAQGVAHSPNMHPNAVANGGLLTTPTDLALFAIELMKAYRGESNTILSQATVRNMFRRELDLDPGLLGVPLGEGLGVLLYGTGQNFRFLHPGDNMPGASCWLVGVPDSGKGAVIMTNGAKGNLLAMEIGAAISVLYSWPPSQ